MTYHPKPNTQPERDATMNLIERLQLAREQAKQDSQPPSQFTEVIEGSNNQVRMDVFGEHAPETLAGIQLAVPERSLVQKFVDPDTGRVAKN